VSELPRGWTWAYLEDFAEVGTGTTPSRSNPAYWTNGSIPWITSTAVNQPLVKQATEFVSDAALNATTLRFYPKHTLILALYGEGKTRGKVSELEIEATINQALAAICIHEVVSECRPFIKYFLERNYVELRRQAAGGMQPNLNLSIVKRIKTPLAPFKEQRRIVAKIDELFADLDAGVAALERVRAKLKRYRAAVLKAAVEGKLTEDWRAQHPDTEPASILLNSLGAERQGFLLHVPDGDRTNTRRSPRLSKSHSFDERDLFDAELPSGWRSARLDHVCTEIVDCPHSTPRWTDEGVACVRTTEFRPGRLLIDDVRFVSERTYEERTARLKPESGDILYSREGGILGIACTIPPSVRLCLGQRMMLMRPFVSNRYIMHVLNSPQLLSRVAKLTGGSASPPPQRWRREGFPDTVPSSRRATRHRPGD
jgi:type I restriction enzyme, S subunit